MKTKSKLSVNLSPVEVAHLLLAVGVERARYKDVVIEDWTESVKALDRARHKLWLLKTFHNDDVLDLTREEWRSSMHAVEFEIGRWQTRWASVNKTEETETLHSIHSKILGFLENSK